MEVETDLTKALPNEILLHIFRFLEHKDLISAEQVCWRWKTMVEACFATQKRLTLSFSPEDYSFSLNRMKRYGSSILTLRFMWDYECECTKLNWAEEIANRFPNLLTLALLRIQITNTDFKCLSNKCSQLRNVTLENCCYTSEGLRTFLEALPGITFLDMFRNFSTPEWMSPPPPDFYIPDWFPVTDVSAVFPTCRNLHTLDLSGPFLCSDTASFSGFCKECVTLRRLRILFMEDVPNEMVAQIQHCSSLEELHLDRCDNVDDSTLIDISKGCPNLEVVHLLYLRLVTDRGLKCFARCKYLHSFSTSDEMLVTDETLIELSKCVNLRKVALEACLMVSDRGCAALLAHCQQLELLDVERCEGISNATVDSAIQAVERRRNGLVLQLRFAGTKISRQKYENCPPLLHLVYGW